MGHRLMQTGGLEARASSMRATTLALVCVLLFLAASVRAPAQTPPLPTTLHALREAITSGDILGARHGDFARYRPALARLYGDSGAHSLWITSAGLTRQAEALLGALAAAESRGLRPSDYDVESLAQGVATPMPGEEALLRFDAALSLAAMRLMDHAHRGRVDPRTLGFALGVPHAVHDLVPQVRSLSSARDVHAAIDAVEPAYARYRALEQTLGVYRALAANPALSPVPASRGSVHPGQPWAGTPALQQLLVALGDLPATLPRVATDTFGGALVDGVKRFQRRHGLAQDGVVGGATLQALRTPLQQRVMQIELAMERWRWLPDITAPRLVVVNIPAFRLYAFDRATAGERPVERMDVIVGSAYNGRHTPVFTGTMRAVVFHPYWDVPPSIARREEIPHLRRDPGYAERQGLEIVSGGDVGATIFPMTRANLDRVAAGTLRLRQRPGPGNALGPVKFVFPNAFNVYLHGTPAQSLFARTRRDFSHGCIRTSNPARLAEFVLAGQRGWDAARIAASMREGEPLQRVALDRPLPVYVLYTTVVTDDAGVPFFYPDLYGHDATLGRMLALPIRPRLMAGRDADNRSLWNETAGNCLTDNE
jgi:murein L,D-transpeptidase YcbB/YkuD